MTAGVVVAAVSFVVLTTAAATSELRVTHTVNRSFRPSYDILVRPAGTRTGIERRRGLVRPNFLSGIFGGITLGQYRQIRRLPGVQVAAPVAMVGYVMPFTGVPISLPNTAGSGQRRLFRIQFTWSTDRGLSTYATGDHYDYVTSHRIGHTPDGTPVEVIGPRRVPVCSGFDKHTLPPTTPSQQVHRPLLSCFSTDTGGPRHGRAHEKPKRLKDSFDWVFPVLIAAIDPVAEAKLVGLDQAVVSGRYLQQRDHPRLVPSGSLKIRTIPVIAASQPALDEHVQVKIRRLKVKNSAHIPAELATAHARHFLQHLPGVTVRTITLGPQQPYRRLLGQLQKNPPLPNVDGYWSVAGPHYRQVSGNWLRPKTVTNPASVWQSTYLPGGFVLLPPATQDPQFRHVGEHVVSNSISGAGVPDIPALHEVGEFNANKLRSFSALSKVPLGVYKAPTLTPADRRSKRLLHGQTLLPDGNIGGYLNQPPLLLTDLRSLRALTNSAYFKDTDAHRPISSIRVRVSGVHGVDAVSRARIQAVAQAIVQHTGLTVDITTGSSPHPQIIRLPAGTHGRPPLTLTESWVKKGVAIAVVTAVDQKSLSIFALVLVVCIFFVLNAASAGVRSRQGELALLSCLGWSRRRLFALIETELGGIGFVAGVISYALAFGIGWIVGLHPDPVRDALIIPGAATLTAIAGLRPASQASRTAPLLILQATGAPSGHGGRATSLTRLGWTNLARSPGRTLTGAAGLFLAVSAFTVLTAIMIAFRGQLADTLLGNAVVIEVRAVDYIAVGMILLLGALSVADVVYINIAERRAEIVVMRAAGWHRNHLYRLLTQEGLTTAALGSVLGGLVGIALSTLALSVPATASVAAASIGAAAGLMATCAAITVPLSRLSRLTPIDILTTE